jgi:hypothetical protein
MDAWHDQIDGMPLSVTIPAMDVGRSVGRSIYVTAEVANVVTKLEVACARLRARVIPFDRLMFGDSVESLRELAIRGQMFVVVMCLRRLRDVIPARSASGEDSGEEARHGGLGGFASIDEVAMLIELELNRITSVWAPLRRTNRPPGEDPASHAADDRAARYRAAVQAAQGEMTALLGITKLGGFLQAGVMSQALPEVRTACARMATALQINLTAEPSIPLLDAADPAAGNPLATEAMS